MNLRKSHHEQRARALTRGSTVSTEPSTEGAG